MKKHTCTIHAQTKPNRYIIKCPPGKKCELMENPLLPLNLSVQDGFPVYGQLGPGGVEMKVLLLGKGGKGGGYISV